MDLSFIPKPNEAPRMSGGAFVLPDAYGVDPGDFAPWAVRAFLERVPGGSVSREGVIRLERRSALAEEGYELRIAPEGVTVAASGEQGVLWGLTSLAHVLEGRRAPCLSLSDRPRYAYRGLMLDCARHFFPVEEILRILEQMGRVKLNRLHWHLTDDQGWRIECRAFPKLHLSVNRANGETEPLYYTREDIRRVVDFARERGITVVPEVELPGHSATALAAYPQWSCTGEPAQVYAGTGISRELYCAGKDETLAAIKTVLTEVAELFPGRLFHLGGDEAPKGAWRACPACQARMKKEGLKTEEELQGWLMNWAIGVLRGLGKEAVCWNEALKPGMLDPSAHVQFWVLLGKKDYVSPAVDRGQSLIFSGVFQNYLDYSPAMIPVWKTLLYEPRVGRRSFADHPGTLGIESPLWTERVDTPEKLERQLFPRAFATAEAGWTRKRTYRDFRPRLVRALDGLGRAGMTCTPLEEAERRGFGRIRAILRDMAAQKDAMMPSPDHDNSGLNEVMDKDAMGSMARQMIKNWFF